MAMRFGAVPVVNATGGLKDTVPAYEGPESEGRGFTFQSYNADDFLAAIDRALALYYDAPAQWQELVRHDMSQDFGWDKGAEHYMALYHKALGDKA